MMLWDSSKPWEYSSRWKPEGDGGREGEEEKEDPGSFGTPSLASSGSDPGGEGKVLNLDD